MSGPNVEDYTPGWTSAGDDRWRKVDEIGVMHLLLKVGGRYLELHGLTLHLYDGPDDVADDVWPLGDPLGPVRGYTYVATYDVSSSALTLYHDESEVWAWLERYAQNDSASR